MPFGSGRVATQTGMHRAPSLRVPAVNPRGSAVTLGCPTLGSTSAHAIVLLPTPLSLATSFRGILFRESVRFQLDLDSHWTNSWSGPCVTNRTSTASLRAPAATPRQGNGAGSKGSVQVDVV